VSSLLCFIYLFVCFFLLRSFVRSFAHSFTDAYWQKDEESLKDVPFDVRKKDI